MAAPGGGLVHADHDHGGGCGGKVLLCGYDLDTAGGYPGILHAAGICDGGDWAHKSKECRQHRHEEFHGLCTGYGFLLVPRLWLMFGTDFHGIIGIPDPFVQNFHVADDAGFPDMAFLIFQTVFCATSATIVSGAMAERTKFSVYCIYSVLISLLIYPISGHWIWGGGWLQELGFHDFAGSTCVHMVGGVCALVGAGFGPRIGKYNKDGSVNAIPGHSLPLACLACSSSGSAGSGSMAAQPFP